MSLLLLFLNPEEAAAPPTGPGADPNTTLWLILFGELSQRIERK